MFTRSLGLLTLTTAVLAFGATPRGAEERREFTSTMYGFEIDPPKFKPDAAAMSANVAYFFGPAVIGHSPNLAIHRHKHDSEFKRYVELSEAQFTTDGLTVKSSKPGTIDGRESHQWTYAAKLGEHELEFLVCAVREPDHVLLFTYTARADDFEATRKLFDASLATLRFDD